MKVPDQNRSPRPTHSTPQRSTTTSKPSRPTSPPPDQARVSGEARARESQTSAPNFSSWASLRQGSQDSESIRGLQGALNQKGAKLEVDGKFGAATAAAVKSFQGSHSLEQDGVAGRKTYEKLAGAQAPKAAPEAGKKPDVFAFACKPLSPGQIHDLGQKHGKNVMVGIDPSYAGSKASMQAVKKEGMRAHAYLGGPSGLTDGKWDSVERKRLEKNAAALGYDVNTKEGMAGWNREGWKKYTDSQLRKAKESGFESAEIDNLDRGLGKDPSKLLGYYSQYAKKFQNGEYPKLMMKNIDEKQMKAVSEAIGSGKLPREMFSDFHIWESNFGKNPPGNSAKISQGVGIQTIESPDTNNYSSSNIPALGRDIWNHRKDPDSAGPALW